MVAKHKIQRFKKLPSIHHLGHISQKVLRSLLKRFVFTALLWVWVWVLVVRERDRQLRGSMHTHVGGSRLGTCSASHASNVFPPLAPPLALSLSLLVTTSSSSRPCSPSPRPPPSFPTSSKISGDLVNTCAHDSKLQSTAVVSRFWRCFCTS